MDFVNTMHAGSLKEKNRSQITDHGIWDILELDFRAKMLRRKAG
jgi:hypothetical protein